MCRPPAILSTSGLTRRATDLISRLVRGPRRRAFLAGRGDATGPAAELGLLYGADCRTGAFRPGIADIVDLRYGRISRPIHHQDERRAGNVTGEAVPGDASAWARPAARTPRDRFRTRGFRAGSSGVAICPGRRSGSARRCGR